jgi:formylmethanofuran dehydrogenase subunit E
LTEFTDKVIAQRIKLEQEEENKKIAWYEARNEYIKTAFKGGIVKTEYTDKRKSIRVYCAKCGEDVSFKDITRHTCKS